MSHNRLTLGILSIFWQENKIFLVFIFIFVVADEPL